MAAAIVAGARLVTVVGPAGIGKTSLALDFARGSAVEHRALCEAAVDAPGEDVGGITLAGFAVALLADTCSERQRGYNVALGTYHDDEPTLFLGGATRSTAVRRNCCRLRSGQAIPFHTN
ncbi:MAG: putative ATPase [Bradymonadia bacterium]